MIAVRPYYLSITTYIQAHHERHTDQRIRQGTCPIYPPTNRPLTQPGTRRPQSPRPPHTYAQIRRVPNRHPRFGDQFLRPPPDPRQIPTPTRLPLGSWFRVLWRRPQSANRPRRRQDTKVQRGRQGLWRFARRLRNTHCLHRGAAQGRP